MATEVVVNNLDDLEKWVKSILPQLGKQQLVLLQGPMGVGKTKVVEFMMKHLGSEQVCSPSYAIHNQYQTQKGIVDHLDLYRLKDEDDLESTGFWDLFESDQGLIIIEWADRLDRSYLPSEWSQLSIHLEFIEGQSEKRKIIVS